jgi:hypothetical protein
MNIENKTGKYNDPSFFMFSVTTLISTNS